MMDSEGSGQRIEDDPDRSSPDQFVELYVRDPADYLRLFTRCLGYQVARTLDGWMDLRRAKDRILLNFEEGAQLGDDHPFREHHTAASCGYGVEIAIVVDADLEAMFECISDIGWRMEPVKMREWGVRDFRVTTTEGYYLRITERQAPRRG
jgi:hypothetical protein